MHSEMTSALNLVTDAGKITSVGGHVCRSDKMPHDATRIQRSQRSSFHSIGFYSRLITWGAGVFSD